MEIRFEKNGVTTIGVANIVEDIVCRGSDGWHAGVEVIGLVDCFADETVAYAMNDGRVLFAKWEEEPELYPEFSFEVTKATDDEIRRLWLLNATPPPGSMLITQEGQVYFAEGAFFRSADGCHTTMAELNCKFELRKY